MGLRALQTTGGIIDIPIINDDFKVELKEPNALLKFIGAAFGMAGGLVAYGRFGELTDGHTRTECLWDPTQFPKVRDIADQL